MNMYAEFKRRYQREKVRVWTWMVLSRDGMPRVTRTIDLTPEGAQFSSVLPVDPYLVVLLRFQLEEPPVALECKGRVCWSRMMDDGLYHYGVRFVDLSDDERDMLDLQMPGTCAAAEPSAQTC